MSVELLAPAGGEQQLLAAVFVGADAVYLGMKQFSARMSAINFDCADLQKAVSFCHSFGVKAYLALNTLIAQHEWPQAEKAVRFACQIGVDALIVQDLGLAAFVRHSAPDMPLHASTQMSVHTPQGAKFLKEQGFSRVVAAREMTLQEISQLCKTGVEIEVFVHGALCFSVSGQCYLSSMLGARSANRGQCAQPCRLPFFVGQNMASELSLKDLCAVQSVAQLKKAGVSSLKIEGRMKRPEYVAAAVSVYRDALNGKPIQHLFDLQSVFSRDGFTNGYINNQRNESMFGVRSKKDAPPREVYSRLRELYRRPLARLPLNIDTHFNQGQAACITAMDVLNGKKVEIRSETVCFAQTAGITKQQVQNCLQKLGGTPYFLSKVNINVQDGTYVSGKTINQMRRQAVKQLMQQRKKIVSKSFNAYCLPPAPNKKEQMLQSTKSSNCSQRLNQRPQKTKMRIECDKWEQIVCPQRFEMIALDLEEMLKHLEIIESSLIPKLAVLMPRTMFGCERQIQQKLERVYRAGVRHLVVQNLAHIPLGAKFVLHGGYALNVTNQWALNQLKHWGAVDCVLSFECREQTLKQIMQEIPCGILVYGYLPLIIARNCPAKKKTQCLRCSKKFTMTDRKGKQFHAACSGRAIELFNADLLWLGDKKQCWDFFSFGVMKFTTQTQRQALEHVDLFFNGGKPKQITTNGLFYRGF